MPGAGGLRPRAAAEERSRGARLARWERGASWALLALAGLVGAVTTVDAWRDVGQVVPGFALMETLQAGPGGVGRGAFEPFDLIRAVNGREVASAAEVRAEAARHPPGTVPCSSSTSRATRA
ncbi:MAG TPA: hypothetical protein VMT79_22045 [Candidatus Binatia bacterium]|nr:hypothetical protein [Candidatus Binatia bacterium]